MSSKYVPFSFCSSNDLSIDDKYRSPIKLKAEAMMLVKDFDMLDVAVPPNTNIWHCSTIQRTKASKIKNKEKFTEYEIRTTIEEKFIPSFIFYPCKRYSPNGGNIPRSQKIGIILITM